MKIEFLPPSELKPFEKNPRINKNAVEYVVKSIRKNGFNQPIVTNQKLEICVGHTRWLAAQELGMKTVPVYVKKMSRKEFLAYNIADNKTNEKSKWDYDLLSELLEEINKADQGLLEATGFDDSELNSLLASRNLDDVIGDEVDVSGHTRTINGDKVRVKLVQLFLNETTFPKFLDMVEIIQAKNNKESMTDAVYYAVEKASQ